MFDNKVFYKESIWRQIHSLICVDPTIIQDGLFSMLISAGVAAKRFNGETDYIQKTFLSNILRYRLQGRKCRKINF